MTDAECHELYTSLEELLNELGLEWVNEIWNQEINIGQLTQRQEEYQSNFSSRSRNSLMRIEYSESQKLKILLNIVEQAIVETALMEERIFECFVGIEQVNFSGEDNSSSFSIMRNSSRDVNHLRELIEQILEELE